MRDLYQLNMYHRKLGKLFANLVTQFVNNVVVCLSLDCFKD